ncbi:MAG: TraR/DksA family transcriptional regulator [Xanthomonadales bacterium]|nr:TraR/DksA family transcriptional regulator [Xanthomonadales bacterium]
MQVRDFKKILDDRFFELREEIRLELLKADDQSYIELAGKVHDVGEASVADLLVDLQLSDIDRHIQEIRDIDVALLRIASSDFGICVDCKLGISFDRLQAYPTAKRCHRCQVNHEHCYAGKIPPSM